MPKIKEIYKLTAKIYRHQTIDNWLFGYMIALRNVNRDISLKASLEMFAKDFGLEEDDFPLESMIQKWYNMSKDYIDEEKT